MTIYPWQKYQWNILVEANKQERLSHAYLLAGIKGLGKDDFAITFANFMLCENKVVDAKSSCGVCKGCQLFNAGSHPDYFIITPHEKNHAVKIDQVRDLSQKLTQKSQRGGYKIVIITPADAMPVGAANALLKTLEEPVGNSLFLLVTDCQEKLPATILSRCQKIDFNISNAHESIAWLTSEMSNCDNLDVLLSLANYAPLQVKSLVENNYLQLRNNVIHHLQNILMTKTNPIAPVSEWVKLDSDLLFHVLITWAMDLSKLQFEVNDGLVNFDCEHIMRKIISCISKRDLQFWLEYVVQRKQILSRGSNLNLQLVFEDILLRLSSLYSSNL